MPDSPGPLVALRDRREQVIAILTEQFSRDTLEIEELERRLDLAHRADSVAALDALVTDLAASATALAPVARPVDDAALARWPERRHQVAIFGGVQKRGAWVCPRRLTVAAIMGGAEIDLREAELAPGVTELRITAIMGGVDVIVPPWLSIECDTTAILGGFDELHRAPVTPEPDRRVLRITGVAIMGGVDIETRLPGESRREARKRVKREARALKGEARAALPEARALGRDRD
ncbi:MAG: DUF1707 domain-containing protein [Myxococcales bacterium]|nr:DUF1707 domain-containing protein [Myxococcales bacterium]